MYIAIAKFANISYNKAFDECNNKILFITEFLPAMVLNLIWKKFNAESKSGNECL